MTYCAADNCLCRVNGKYGPKYCGRHAGLAAQELNRKVQFLSSERSRRPIEESRTEKSDPLEFFRKAFEKETEKIQRQLECIKTCVSTPIVQIFNAPVILVQASSSDISSEKKNFSHRIPIKKQRPVSKYPQILEIRRKEERNDIVSKRRNIDLYLSEVD